MAAIMLNLIEAKHLSRVKTYLGLGRGLRTNSKHGKTGLISKTFNFIQLNLYNLILCSREYNMLFSSTGSLPHSVHCLLSNCFIILISFHGITCAFFYCTLLKSAFQKESFTSKGSVRKLSVIAVFGYLRSND